MSTKLNPKATVIVVAGTPVDTAMGAHLVEHTDLLTARSHPISRTPAEQNAMQYMSKPALQSAFDSQIALGLEEGGGSVLLYCNSLSTAVDYRSTSAQLKVPIITPLDIYRRWALSYSRLALITANAQAAAGIEAHMREVNPHIEILSLGVLPVVEAIEAGEAPEEIVHSFHLDRLMGWLSDLSGVEGIVLGCTHFPYLKDALVPFSQIPLLDPAQDMIHDLLVLSQLSGE